MCISISFFIVSFTYIYGTLLQILRSVNRIVDFAGPILVEDDKQLCCQASDMALTRL